MTTKLIQIPVLVSEDDYQRLKQLAYVISSSISHAASLTIIAGLASQDALQSNEADANEAPEVQVGGE